MNHDSYAEQVRMNYDVFASKMVSAYLQAKAATVGGAPSAVNDFRLKAVGEAINFSQTSIKLAHLYMSDTRFGTLPSRAERIKEHTDTLRAVAMGNVNDMLQSLMGLPAMRLNNTLVRPAGAMSALLAMEDNSVRLVYKDKMGRQRDAAATVRVMAREFSYNNHIDAQLQTIPTSAFQVVYADPNHEFHGRVMTKADLPALRKRIFHPNSTAEVVAYVPS